MLTIKRISFHNFQKAVNNIFQQMLFKRKNFAWLRKFRKTIVGINIFLRAQSCAGMSIRSCDFQYILKLF